MRALQAILTFCVLAHAGAALTQTTDSPADTGAPEALTLTDFKTMLGGPPSLERLHEAEEALRAGRVEQESALEAIKVLEHAYREYLMAQEGGAESWTSYATFLNDALRFISGEDDRLASMPPDPVLQDAEIPPDLLSGGYPAPERLLYAWCKVVKLEPQNPWPHNELGYFYCDENGVLGFLEGPGASRSYERGLKHFYYAARKGRALLERGVTEELRRDVATYLHNLALFSEQHPEEAKDVYALAHDGRRPSAMDLYRWTLDLFEEGFEVNPADAELAWNYAATAYDKIYYRLRNTPEMLNDAGRPRMVLSQELASLVDWQTALEMVKRYVELRGDAEPDDRVKQAYQLWQVFYAQRCAAQDAFTEHDRERLRDIMARQDAYIAGVTPGPYEVSESRREFREELMAAIEEQVHGGEEANGGA